jgi:hypothetical protein
MNKVQEKAESELTELVKSGCVEAAKATAKAANAAAAAAPSQPWGVQD